MNMTNPNTGLRLVEAVLHFSLAADISQPSEARLTPSYLYAGVTLTVIHERMGDEVVASDIYQHIGFANLHLADGESLTLLARYEGAIIASGVFEVNLAATDVGLLLLPRACSNLLLHQIAVDRYRIAALDVAHTAVDEEDDEEEVTGHATGC